MPLLSESILKFSDDESSFIDKNDSFSLKKQTPEIPSKILPHETHENELLQKYERSKINKQIHCNYMMRVNDELQNEVFAFKTRFDENIRHFDSLETLIDDSLEQQRLLIQRRVFKRNSGSVRKSDYCQSPSVSKRDNLVASVRDESQQKQAGKMEEETLSTQNLEFSLFLNSSFQANKNSGPNFQGKCFHLKSELRQTEIPEI